jgi:hypothetical protein
MQPLFPKWFNPHRRGPQAPKRKAYAVFPDGTEAEIVKLVSPVSGRGTLYRVQRPDGGQDENSVLGDLKCFLEREFPGTKFKTRAA